MQQTNLNYDTIVIRICVMLRNVYEIMLLRKLCELNTDENMKLIIFVEKQIIKQEFLETNFKIISNYVI